MHGFAAIKGNLVWEQCPSSPLLEREVRVRIRASAVNRADILQLEGLYAPPPGESEILGLEMSGEIIDTGSAVQTLAKGDRVCALLGSGGYANHCTLDERRCIKIPTHLSFVEAAAIPESFFTAMVNVPQLKAGSTVLVRAAASGVGVALLQYSRAKLSALSEEASPSPSKSKVVGLVSSHDKVIKLQALFPDCKIFDSEEAIIEAVGLHSVDTIFNLVGGKTFVSDVRFAAFGGHIILLATLAGRTSELDIGQVLKKNLTITGSTLRTRSQEEKIALTERFKNEVLPLFENKSLHPVIDRIFALPDARQAIRYVEQRKNVGKVVLRVP